VHSCAFVPRFGLSFFRRSSRLCGYVGNPMPPTSICRSASPIFASLNTAAEILIEFTFLRSLPKASAQGDPIARPSHRCRAHRRGVTWRAIDRLAEASQRRHSTAWGTTPMRRSSDRIA